MTPLVSICIPTYNGSQYLDEALASIVLQSYSNIEIIVSDDASSDNTVSIVEEFKKSVSIPIYIYNHQPNGIGANWNNCIKKANGEYIKFLFQDDVLKPNCISEMIKGFAIDNKIQLVGSKRNFIIEPECQNEIINEWVKKYKDLQVEFSSGNDEMILLEKSIFSSPLFKSSPLNKIGEPSTVLFKKSLVKKIGYFDENLDQILDYEYWYRILKKYKIIILNQELVAFRIHSTQATNVNRNRIINDYKRYEEILYKSYYQLLHHDVQKQLYTKFGFIPRLQRKIKRIIKKVSRRI